MKIMRFPLLLAQLALLAALALPLCAQTTNTIHIRLLDGKTGLPIQSANFMLRVDRRQTEHNEWLVINDDGTVVANLPAAIETLSLKATYNASMDTYIDCAITKEKDRERDLWYSVADILKTGLVAPNECSKANFTAKPGEFIFFVRKRNWHDSVDE
jgi:hypothetical protein